MSSSSWKAPNWLKTLLTPFDAARGAYENIVDNLISNFDLTLVAVGIIIFLTEYPSKPSALMELTKVHNFHVHWIIVPLASVSLPIPL